MSPFEQAFPGFVQACADLHAVLTPVGFALLVLAFAFKFWSRPPTAPELVWFLILVFLVVLLMGNTHRLINYGQAVVADLVTSKVPARPENVAARYQQKLAEAQNAPHLRDQSFWSTLFSSHWFEAIIFACLTLLSWLAMALMYFVYSVQRAVLLVCWVLSAILLPTLAIPPVSSLGLRHILRTIGIILWPLGLALAGTFTDGLISSAVDQDFLASGSRFGWLGYGVQNLLAITVVAVWIIFSTVLAPLFIQKLIAGTAGPTTVLTGAASLINDLLSTALWGSHTRFRSRGAHSQASRLTPKVTQTVRPPPMASSPLHLTPATIWQPRLDDPTGDRHARALAEELMRS